MTVRLLTSEAKDWICDIRAGEQILLSGTVYTARDAAHKRISKLIEHGLTLPFELSGAFIYYAGPTPTKNGMPIGSCGPTTASRMDIYTPTLHSLGLCATIGKGERSREVEDAIKQTRSCYLCAVGGAGALAAKSVLKSEVIAFEDLGCESIKRLTIKDFPLFVGIDCLGGNIFRH